MTRTYNEDCPNYMCRDCAYKGSYPNFCTKRIDHINIEKAVPWFVCCPEETGMPCCEFYPSAIHVWDLKNYWIDWEHWWSDYLGTWTKMNPDKELVWFCLHGDKSVRYGVPLMDYIYGTMYDGTVLKAKKKMYYKSHSHRLIVEDIDEVDMEVAPNVL